jgi:hypothetical protein
MLTVLLCKLSALNRLLTVLTRFLVVSEYVDNPESCVGGYRVRSSGGNLYEYKGLRTVVGPEGETICTVVAVVMGGKSDCEAQSQYGKRKLSAAAW